jgi:predicted dehydrogenase
MRIGLCGIDGSHAEDFIRHFNAERRFPEHAITAVWGGTPARTAELLAGSGGVEAAATLPGLVGMVDAVIVGDRHGGLHRAHALPCLAAGRPVFVDKPLANSLADAEAMTGEAARLGVPLCSASALRWQTETAALGERIAAAPGPLRLTAWGTWFPDNDYGGAIYYAIHAVELAQELMGPDWREVAIAEASGGLAVTYRSARGEVRLELRPPDAAGRTGFGVRVEGGGLAVEQPIPLGDDYMAPVCARIVGMLETGRSPLSPEALLAPVALMGEIERRRSGRSG